MGTYGAASAQFYWGRMATLSVDWGLCVCGWLFLAASWPLRAHSVSKKAAIGAPNAWLGFIFILTFQLVRMAPTKHELVMENEGY